MRFHSVRQYRAWKDRLPLHAPALFLLCACLLALPAVADTRRVEGLAFDAVLIYGGVDVEVSQGDTVELLMRGDAADLASPPFVLEDGNLLLGINREQRQAGFSDVQFKLRTPKLDHIELKGDGDVYVRPFSGERLFASLSGDGQLHLFEQRADDLVLQLNGTGDLLAQALRGASLAVSLAGTGDLQMGRVEVTAMQVLLRGAGDVSVNDKGRVDSLEINIVGSGDVDLRALDATEAEINIVGSGDARIGLVDALGINILGSGDIGYRGQPEITSTILGSGDVQEMR